MPEPRDMLTRLRWWPYAASLIAIVAVTGLGFATYPLLHTANVDTLYLLVVFTSALYFGTRPAVFTALLAAVVFNFCFVEPRFRWGTSDLPYLTTLIVFVVVAVVTGRLVEREREHALDRAAREQAEALNESKDLILHKVSHELRSPMTAILGWIQLLRLDRSDGEELEAGLSGLETSAQLMRRLINDLFDASRAAAGKLSVDLQPTQLAPHVANALDRLRVVARDKGVAVHRVLDDVEAMADGDRIEQIVSNLAYNAVKFTPAGGEIRVTLTASEGQAHIIVSDTGPGIPEEFVPHLFESFSQVDPADNRGGLGLGLLIVKHLVEAHAGTVSVTSDRTAGGSTFAVTIPAMARADDHLQETAAHSRTA